MPMFDQLLIGRCDKHTTHNTHRHMAGTQGVLFVTTESTNRLSHHRNLMTNINGHNSVDNDQVLLQSRTA